MPMQSRPDMMMGRACSAGDTTTVETSTTLLTRRGRSRDHTHLGLDGQWRRKAAPPQHLEHAAVEPGLGPGPKRARRVPATDLHGIKGNGGR